MIPLFYVYKINVWNRSLFKLEFEPILMYGLYKPNMDTNAYTMTVRSIDRIAGDANTFTVNMPTMARGRYKCEVQGCIYSLFGISEIQVRGQGIRACSTTPGMSWATALIYLTQQPTFTYTLYFTSVPETLEFRHVVVSTNAVATGMAECAFVMTFVQLDADGVAITH
jgi:hypothetical protein